MFHSGLETDISGFDFYYRQLIIFIKSDIILYLLPVFSGSALVQAIIYKIKLQRFHHRGKSYITS